MTSTSPVVLVSLTRVEKAGEEPIYLSKVTTTIGTHLYTISGQQIQYFPPTFDKFFGSCRKNGNCNDCGKDVRVFLICSAWSSPPVHVSPERVRSSVVPAMLERTERTPPLFHFNFIKRRYYAKTSMFEIVRAFQVQDPSLVVDKFDEYFIGKDYALEVVYLGEVCPACTQRTGIDILENWGQDRQPED